MGRIGRPWIVALNTIGGLKRLAVMRLHQLGILQIVTVHAKRRSVLGHVISEFTLMGVTSLMNDVARVAAAIQRRMSAPPLINVNTDIVAIQAKILRHAAGHWL